MRKQGDHAAASKWFGVDPESARIIPRLAPGGFHEMETTGRLEGGLVKSRRKPAKRSEAGCRGSA